MLRQCDQINAMLLKTLNIGEIREHENVLFQKIIFWKSIAISV